MKNRRGNNSLHWGWGIGSDVQKYPTASGQTWCANIDRALSVKQPSCSGENVEVYSRGFNMIVIPREYEYVHGIAVERTERQQNNAHNIVRTKSVTSIAYKRAWKCSVELRVPIRVGLVALQVCV
jgi:hypothetical protein